ncbi:Domain of uncharacterised function (DUF2825) [Salmonella enterica]|nr:Domain of uncharacterised function (DUF2825) [Salmonella enterica]
MASVYPRWRGEHQLRLHDIFFCTGLSPLARGTLSSTSPTQEMSRFIPAGAGNTCSSVSGSPEIAVYPRWRGEHIMTVTRILKIGGLSPLARGTREAFADSRRGARFIPAGAGNTLFTPVMMGGGPVYPRWRGEHGGSKRLSETADGLSPLARGTP